jgi:hypothetical protein
MMFFTASYRSAPTCANTPKRPPLNEGWYSASGRPTLGSRLVMNRPATVDSAPIRIVSSKMMTLNAGRATISLPPTMSGQSSDAQTASAAPAALPVNADRALRGLERLLELVPRCRRVDCQRIAIAPQPPDRVARRVQMGEYAQHTRRIFLHRS